MHRPYLVVTMPDLWPRFAGEFDDGLAGPLLVGSLERAELDRIVADLPPFASVIGLGGGQALDLAKYAAWTRRTPLFQVPTVMSVNAAWAHRAAVRVDGVVRYVAWAVPEAVYVDFDVIRSAPIHLNRSGVGDILCYHTGHWDWRMARDRGRVEPRWPYDERLVTEAEVALQRVVDHAQAIHDVTDEGLRALAESLRWGGAAFHNAGWNPRHIEGAEHFVFYVLEHMTGRPFIHGQIVCLGVLLNERAAGESSGMDQGGDRSDRSPVSPRGDGYHLGPSGRSPTDRPGIRPEGGALVHRRQRPARHRGVHRSDGVMAERVSWPAAQPQRAPDVDWRRRAMRRSTLRGSALIAVLAILVGACAGQGARRPPAASTPGATTPGGSPAGSPASAGFDWKAFEGTEVTFLANQHPWTDGASALIDQFTEETGITVNLQPFAEDLYFDKMEQTIRSGGADVYFLPMDSTAYTQYVADLVEPLTPYLDDPAKTSA